MTLSDNDIIHMETMFFLALGGIPDVMLESLARGDDEALDIVKTSASLILQVREGEDGAA